MTVTVTSTASPRLTTLTAVKQELNTTSTDDDSYIDVLIDRASDAIASHTNRTVVRQSYKEELGGSGEPRLVLSHTPLQTITSVKRDGTTVSSTSYKIEDARAGFVWNQNEWLEQRFKVQSITARAKRFRKENYTIEYEAGWTPPSTSTSSTAARDLPRDLEMAAIEIVKWMYTEQGTNPNLRRQEVGETNETKFDRQGSDAVFPPRIELLLSKYVQVDLP